MKNAGGLISARKRKTAYMDETLKFRYTRIVKFSVLLCSERVRMQGLGVS